MVHFAYSIEQETADLQDECCWRACVVDVFRRYGNAKLQCVYGLCELALTQGNGNGTAYHKRLQEIRLESE